MRNLILGVASICLTAGCGGHDSEYIPYELTSLDVYLYDARKAPDADYFAGSISCSYINRESGLSQARSLAYQVARQRGFETDGADRYYIICCMTKNGCATKVR